MPERQVSYDSNRVLLQVRNANPVIASFALDVAFMFITLNLWSNYPENALFTGMPALSARKAKLRFIAVCCGATFGRCKAGFGFPRVKVKYRTTGHI
jgi:hypothetical protein